MNDRIERLVNRARQLLIYMPPTDAMARLAESEATREEAYLAVVAATLL